MIIDFSKNNGLVPVIIQDELTMQVLMLAYMNNEAYEKTLSERKVTFYSRSRNKLWTKGETSGNYLFVKSIQLDCDNDTILIKVNPAGPCCHTGAANCFNENSAKGFIYKLEDTIEHRIIQNDVDSYTNKLVKSGINKVAQKVGEEAVELIIEAKDSNNDLFINEAADLFYHYLILLKAKNLSFAAVEETLNKRSKK